MYRSHRSKGKQLSFQRQAQRVEHPPRQPQSTISRICRVNERFWIPFQGGSNADSVRSGNQASQQFVSIPVSFVRRFPLPMAHHRKEVASVCCR